jgi:hypothetical protein
MSAIQDILVETDARGRTNLSKFSKNDKFLASREDDGTIILQPARIVSAAEDRLRRNPETLKRLQAVEAELDSAEVLHLCED